VGRGGLGKQRRGLTTAGAREKQDPLAGEVPVLYASNDTSGNSNRLILLGGLAWVALVLVNWGMSVFVV